jgi:hypothetical protein
MHMVHADRLKPCITGERVELFQFGTTPGDIEEEEPAPGEWNVERILAHRFVRGRPEFITKWKGAAQGKRHGNLWEIVSTGTRISCQSIARKRG